MTEIAGSGPVAVDADVRWAMHAVRTHCPIEWPQGSRCLNCRAPFPCSTYGWAFDVLVNAGWNASQIDALDSRTGPWS